MKKKIALITGGFSGEAVISYKSATTIYNNLDKELFDVYTIDVTKGGWYYRKDDVSTEVDKNDFSLTIDSRKITFDAVFIGLHGTPGEDGKLQGYFDLLRIPYTSCNAATSALTFNKRYTVAVAAMAGIPVAKSVLLIKDQFANADEVVSNLQFPVFVKPNNGGSSIGMSKVNAATEELGIAIEKAFGEDDQVLVEEFIRGREFTVGVFRQKAEVVTLPITEIISKNEFFDFKAKYEGMSTEITPADIPLHWQQLIEKTVAKIYRVFNCDGVVRIDFIYDEQKGKPYMLEINTVPGQSEASVIPQQVKAQGGTLQDFYSNLVRSAIER